MNGLGIVNGWPRTLFPENDPARFRALVSPTGRPNQGGYLWMSAVSDAKSFTNLSPSDVNYHCDFAV